jgi:hypothetical protein
VERVRDHFRDSLDRCRDKRLPRRPGRSKRIIPCLVFSVGRPGNGCRNTASLYIGSEMIGENAAVGTSEAAMKISGKTLRLIL